jgi:protein-S-isoprenylcysteine O-methyltransferase Ste14
MSIWDSLAGSIHAVAAGDKRRRNFVKALMPFILYVIITLFVFASFWVDKWLAFPHCGSSSWSLGLSVFMLVIGWLIMFWPVIAFFSTRGTPVPFNPPPKLITTGLYAYVRNPMLLGMFIFMLGLGVLFGSLSFIFIFTPLFIVINALYLKAIEEKEMEKKFGRDYLEYKKKVPMFFPRFRRQK